MHMVDWPTHMVDWSMHDIVHCCAPTYQSPSTCQPTPTFQPHLLPPHTHTHTPLHTHQDTAYWVSWAATHMSTLAVTAFLCALVGIYPFAHSSASLLLVFYLLVDAALMAWAYFLSTLFSKSRVAGTATAVLYSLAMVPGYVCCMLLACCLVVCCLSVCCLIVCVKVPLYCMFLCIGATTITHIPSTHHPHYHAPHTLPPQLPHALRGSLWWVVMDMVMPATPLLHFPLWSCAYTHGGEWSRCHMVNGRHLCNEFFFL